MDKTFNPEKYGMTFCPDCKGKGKLPKRPDGFIVCSRCGGSGVIKKEEKALKWKENKRNTCESGKSKSKSIYLS